MQVASQLIQTYLAWETLQKRRRRLVGSCESPCVCARAPFAFQILMMGPSARQDVLWSRLCGQLLYALCSIDPFSQARRYLCLALPALLVGLAENESDMTSRSQSGRLDFVCL